ncbi:MAG: carboxypeptidase-like regulatory domain-containing protein, partial [Limisphaerales bacterium]
MKQKLTLTLAALALSAWLVDAKEIRGKVTKDDKGVGGVFVSAHDTENRKATGVFTAADGSYTIDGLRQKDYRVRARQKGLNDVWLDDITAGTKGVEIKMTNATGWKLERQRTADSAFGMLKFDNSKDKLNFKMFCTYCHQVGTVPFRTPEQPVDWETMIRRMDGFGGLYRHSQKTIIKRIIDAY